MAYDHWDSNPGPWASKTIDLTRGNSHIFLCFCEKPSKFKLLTYFFMEYMEIQVNFGMKSSLMLKHLKIQVNFGMNFNVSFSVLVP